MDGTLVDLVYDNLLWDVHVPTQYAAKRQISVSEAHDELFGSFSPPHTLSYYSIKNWENRTGLDIVGLHHSLRHLLVMRPRVREFLSHELVQTRQTCIATNADVPSVQVKTRATGLLDLVDDCYSAHEIGSAKEEMEFWSELRRRISFDPSRSMMVDDNATVLAAAAKFGVAHCFLVTQPDFTVPPVTREDFPTINELTELFN